MLGAFSESGSVVLLFHSKEELVSPNGPSLPSTFQGCIQVSKTKPAKKEVNKIMTYHGFHQQVLVFVLILEELLCAVTDQSVNFNFPNHKRNPEINKIRKQPKRIPKNIRPSDMHDTNVAILKKIPSHLTNRRYLMKHNIKNNSHNHFASKIRPGFKTASKLSRNLPYTPSTIRDTSFPIGLDNKKNLTERLSNRNLISLQYSPIEETMVLKIRKVFSPQFPALNVTGNEVTVKRSSGYSVVQTKRGRWLREKAQQRSLSAMSFVNNRQVQSESANWQQKRNHHQENYTNFSEKFLLKSNRETHGQLNQDIVQNNRGSGKSDEFQHPSVKSLRYYLQNYGLVNESKARKNDDDVFVLSQNDTSIFNQIAYGVRNYLHNILFARNSNRNLKWKMYKSVVPLESYMRDTVHYTDISNKLLHETNIDRNFLSNIVPIFRKIKRSHHVLHKDYVVANFSGDNSDITHGNNSWHFNMTCGFESCALDNMMTNLTQLPKQVSIVSNCNSTKCGLTPVDKNQIIRKFLKDLLIVLSICVIMVVVFVIVFYYCRKHVHCN